MMVKYLFSLLLLLSTLTGLYAQPKITIAVAANMQYAMEALKAEFNKTDHTQIDVVLGASGRLTQQIIAGAPFDIFISADTAFPAKIAGAGFAATSPKVYAQGMLVLWTTRAGITPSASNLSILASTSIQHIAIANPQTAPYGAAAEAVLKKYGLYDKVANKLVTGESITQASQFIATQAADIGFTAKAIVISGEMQGKGQWVELKQGDYPAIKQAAVMLKYGQQNHAVETKKFYEFLFSAKAKAIYKKFGYIVI